MRRYNKTRLKVLEGMDAFAMLAILVFASGIDGTEPTLIIKAMLIPSVWLLVRYFANR